MRVTRTTLATRKKIVLSIPTARAKMLLDSAVFDALARRYQIDVVSYLADRPEAVRTYGRDGVRFVPWSDPTGRTARFLLRLSASMRTLGPLPASS